MANVALATLSRSGLIPVGEVRMIPDLSAVQVLPWAPGHIMAPAEMWDRDLSELPEAVALIAINSALH